MKVLIISPKFHPIIGGGETYVYNSAIRLHEAGIAIAVAVEPHPDRNVSGYPFPVIEVEGLSDEKVDVIRGTASLTKVLRDFRPDVIHVHGYFGLLLVGLTNPNQVPAILTVHSTPVWGTRIVGGMDSFDTELRFARNIIKLGEPEVFTAANRVYAEAAEKIVRGKLPIESTPYPVDLEAFRSAKAGMVREELKIEQQQVLIMTPSRIIERKGIREIVEALLDLPEKYVLCLPGAFKPLDKDYWQSITDSASFKKVQHRIIVPDYEVFYSHMPSLYAASDVIVMPSYYEGAPVATVEAMASGKPFVGADSQGINDFIKNEQNGLLVPQKSTKELAAAILRITTDSRLRNTLTSQAQKDIQHLSWEVQLPDLIKLYRRVGD